MHVPFIFLTGTHLLASSDLSGIHTTYQIIRNDNKIDKFKSLVVLYDKNKFTCLEGQSFDGAINFEFTTTLCDFDYFSMLVIYKKTIQILFSLLRM